jgi:hypothetical protein
LPVVLGSPTAAGLVKPTVPDQIDLNVADASSSQPLQSCCDDQLNPPNQILAGLAAGRGDGVRNGHAREAHSMLRLPDYAQWFRQEGRK